MKAFLNHSNKDNQLGVIAILEGLRGNNIGACPGFVCLFLWWQIRQLSFIWLTFAVCIVQDNGLAWVFESGPPVNALKFSLVYKNYILILILMWQPHTTDLPSCVSQQLTWELLSAITPLIHVYTLIPSPSSILPSAASTSPFALVSQQPPSYLVGTFAGLVCALLSGDTEQWDPTDIQLQCQSECSCTWCPSKIYWSVKIFTYSLINGASGFCAIIDISV